ncbi:META domain-containing protein [Marisediminicola antarctica]|uniref:META domain-containing protein n=1 Tax=Marisediminicola antarctica TaxID=674079 RepID=UPI00137ADAC7|nr:META domain-containing protein [Marisediminicola antarctica]
MRSPTRQLAVSAALIGALALSGCAGVAGTTGESADGLHGQWLLVAGADKAGTIGLGHSAVTLSIDGEIGGGSTACNNYTIDLTGGPGAVEIAQIDNTGMICVPLSIMETERRYLAALATVTAAELAGDELRLTTDDIELRFVAWSNDVET